MSHGLSVQGLDFSYPGRRVLAGASLTVEAGTSGFLLGPSGCGKSTLLRCIAGLETPVAGSIRLGDQDLIGVASHRRRVGLLFQEPALFPHMNVLRNVAFGLRYRGVVRSARADEARQWLDLVGLPDRADGSVDDLSGGQRQRVALARTLAARPRAVLLDEPLAALDADLRRSLGNEVKRLLAEQQVPALWVTHDDGEAHRLGDCVWRMHNGACADGAQTP